MAGKMVEIALSPYEEQRTPHPLLEGVIQLPRTALNDQLKCAVCLSIFTDTVATMEVYKRESVCVGCVCVCVCV